MTRTSADAPLEDVVESWPVRSSVDLHRDHWVIALRSDQVIAPGDPEGEAFRRLVVEHPGAVVILAADEDRRVLCLWQYRHPAGRRFVELPAGLCDVTGEEHLEVARRELREEAELQAGEWHLLGSVYSSPGISDEVVHLFLARDLAAADRGAFELQHEEEDMVRDWVPFDDLHEAVVTGRISDSPLMICVLLARARGLL